MLMLLCHAGRLLSKPSSMTAAELQAAERLLKRFCHMYYTHVYTGKEERLRLCRPTVVALLDVPANLRACGPAWSYWQFPAERLIGTLTRLIRSRRFPYAAVTTAVSAKYSAELVTSFAETHVADAWAEATGKPIQRDRQDPAGAYSLSKDPKVDILPPRRDAAALIGQELTHLTAVLGLEGASNIPEKVFAKKHFRLRLANGQIAGTVPSSEDPGDRRRVHLVRVRSHMRQAERRGQGEDRVPVNVYGAAHHYAVVLIDGAPKAYAYLECVKSSSDRHGASRLAEKRRDTECFTSLGGAMRYGNVTAIDAVVGTLFVRERHVVLYLREVFSTE